MFKGDYMLYCECGRMKIDKKRKEKNDRVHKSGGERRTDESSQNNPVSSGVDDPSGTNAVR